MNTRGAMTKTIEITDHSTTDVEDLIKTLVSNQIELARLRARVDELLVSNNEYLQEARDARYEVSRLKDMVARFGIFRDEV